MAIPTVLRNADFPTLDFSNPSTIQTAMLSAMSQAMATFGWNIEFEDSEQIVCSNAGSGYMFKMKKDTVGQRYVIVETAQSWSDIDSPVNPLVNQRFDLAVLGNPNADILFIGDTKRFYFISTSDVDSLSAITRAFFMGDIVTFNTTDPYPFVFIGQQGDAVTGGLPSSISSRGLIFTPSDVLLGSSITTLGAFFGQADGTLGLTNLGLVSPGSSNNMSLSADTSQINQEQPTILIPTYALNASASVVFSGTAGANRMRGIVPGIHSLMSPSLIMSNSRVFSQVTVSGVNVIVMPGRLHNNYCSSGIVLNDWDLLI
tara:strand:+ start:1640 stop:2587 length:948 start_codon:yes stop_codon:yes gene_type:complete